MNKNTSARCTYLILIALLYSSCGHAPSETATGAHAQISTLPYFDKIASWSPLQRQRGFAAIEQISFEDIATRLESLKIADTLDIDGVPIDHVAGMLTNAAQAYHQLAKHYPKVGDYTAAFGITAAQLAALPRDTYLAEEKRHLEAIATIKNANLGLVGGSMKWNFNCLAPKTTDDVDVVQAPSAPASTLVGFVPIRNDADIMASHSANRAQYAPLYPNFIDHVANALTDLYTPGPYTEINVADSNLAVVLGADGMTPYFYRGGEVIAGSEKYLQTCYSPSDRIVPPGKSE